MRIRINDYIRVPIGSSANLAFRITSPLRLFQHMDQVRYPLPEEDESGRRNSASESKSGFELRAKSRSL